MNESEHWAIERQKGNWLAGIDVGDAELDEEGTAKSQEFGVFEKIASGTGIADQARRRFGSPDSDTTSAVLALASGDPSMIETRHVLEAAKAGDAEALRIADQALRYMTRCIANIVGLLNPALVVRRRNRSGSRLLPRRHF